MPRAGAGHGLHALGSRIRGWIVLAVVGADVAARAVGLASPRWRRIAPWAIAWLLGGVVAAYAAGRVVAGLSIVNYSSPASYQDSWGGPGLAGVLAVHSGPGLAVVLAAYTR